MSDFNINNLNVLCQIFIDAIKNELKTKLADLSYYEIKEFGYRQFLSNGTTFGFCTRNIDNIKIKDAQEKNLNYKSLRRFYSQETSNNFVTYRRTKDKIEGFYFLSSSKDPEIINYYLNHIESFEHFINLVSIYVNLALGSMKSTNVHYKNLHKNALNTNLYVKVLSQNSVNALFQKGSLINQEIIQNNRT